jgi:hypothetical protein
MTPASCAQLRSILQDVRALLDDAKRDEFMDPTEAIHSIALAVGHLVMVIDEMLEKTP